MQEITIVPILYLVEVRLRGFKQFSQGYHLVRVRVRITAQMYCSRLFSSQHFLPQREYAEHRMSLVRPSYSPTFKFQMITLVEAHRKNGLRPRGK